MKLVYLVIIVTVALAECVAPDKPKLKGVTIQNVPFVKKNSNGKYSGIAIDLIEFIASDAQFHYELYETPDGLYGFRDKDDNWNGILGQVQSGKADFALADLTITELRSEAVDFTVPYYVTQLAALVNKKYATGLKNLKDLAEKFNGPAVGVIEYGAIHGFLHTSKGETARKLNAKISANEKNFVRTNAAGYERVSKGASPYAFIGESAYVSHYASTHLDVVVLDDQEKLYPGEYGIALPKGSVYLSKFNAAIEKWRQHK